MVLTTFDEFFFFEKLYEKKIYWEKIKYMPKSRLVNIFILPKIFLKKHQFRNMPTFYDYSTISK